MNSTITISTALELFGVLFGGGAGVVLFAQLVKKLFGLNSSHAIHLMVVAVSILVACAQYVLQMKNMPVQVLGVSTLGFYGASQFLYNEAKPLTSFLAQVQAYSASQKAPAAPSAADAAVNDVTAPTDAQLQEETPAETPAADGQFNA